MGGRFLQGGEFSLPDRPSGNSPRVSVDHVIGELAGRDYGATGLNSRLFPRANSARDRASWWKGHPGAVRERGRRALYRRESSLAPIGAGRHALRSPGIGMAGFLKTSSTVPVSTKSARVHQRRCPRPPR